MFWDVHELLKSYLFSMYFNFWNICDAWKNLLHEIKFLSLYHDRFFIKPFFKFFDKAWYDYNTTVMLATIVAIVLYLFMS